MKNPVLLYLLYGINRLCRASIYHRTVELRVPFTVENLVAIHICASCERPLVSAMDVEIKGVPAEGNYGKADKTIFLNN